MNENIFILLEKQQEETKRRYELFPEQFIYDMIKSYLNFNIRTFCDFKVIDDKSFIIILPYYDKDLEQIKIEINTSGISDTKIEIKYYAKDLTVEKITENIERILSVLFVNIDFEKRVLFKRGDYQSLPIMFTHFLQAVILIANL